MWLAGTAGSCGRCTTGPRSPDPQTEKRLAWSTPGAKYSYHVPQGGDYTQDDFITRDEWITLIEDKLVAGVSITYYYTRDCDLQVAECSQCAMSDAYFLNTSSLQGMSKSSKVTVQE